MTVPAEARDTPGRSSGPPPVLLYGLMTAVGLASFLYPFWLPADGNTATAHSADAPLVAAVLGTLVVATLALEVRRGTMNGATVALLAVLATLTGLLRLLDLPGGGSGLFFLAILAGVAFGPRFGLLLGLAAMATSALLTGGVGPWLPFQMLGAGWVALGAGLLPAVAPRAERWLLAGYGAVAALFYGLLLDLWFWPFLATASGGTELAYVAGAPVGENASRFVVFHLLTGLGWDIPRALLTAALCLLAGPAVLTGLRRATRRAAFTAPVVLDDGSRA